MINRRNSTRFLFTGCLLTVGLLLSAQLWAQSEGGADSIKLKPGEPLRARVEHSQMLAPVKPGLEAGVPYRDSMLSTEVEGNDWYPIPDWLTGSWTSDEQIITHMYDFRNNLGYEQHRPVVAKSEFARGHQRDKAGVIWHFTGTPYKISVKGENHSEAKLIRSMQLVQSLKGMEVVRTTDTTVQVMNSTGRVKNVFQNETLTYFEPKQQGVVKATMSIKAFFSNGKPALLQEQYGFESRTGPFEPVDFEDGKDLRLLFKKFLTARGFSDRIPD